MGKSPNGGVSILGILPLLAYLFLISYPPPTQWDFKVYFYATKAFIMGLNPYDPAQVSPIASAITTPYDYPPLSLFLFTLISQLDYQTAYVTWILINLALFTGFVYLGGNLILGKDVDAIYYLFCAFAFKTFLIAIASGNIAVLESFILLLAFYSYMTGKIPNFCILLLVAASFKLAPILLLTLLPLSENKKDRKYLLPSILAFAVYFAVSYLLFPNIFPTYLASLSMVPEYPTENIMNNQNTLWLIRGTLQLIGTYTQTAIPQSTAYLTYAIVVSGILYLSWRAYLSLRMIPIEPTKKRLILIMFTCIVYAIILPRFKPYSYTLLLLPAYFIIRQPTFTKTYPLLASLIIILNIPNSPFMRYASTFIGISPLLFAYLFWVMYLHEINKLKKRGIPCGMQQTGAVTAKPELGRP